MEMRTLFDIIGCVGGFASVYALILGFRTKSQVGQIKTDMQNLNQAFDLIPFASKFNDFNRDFGAAVQNPDFNKGGSASEILDRLNSMITGINKYHAKLSPTAREDIDSCCKSIRRELVSCEVYVTRESGLLISDLVNTIDVILCDEVSRREEKVFISVK